MNSCSNCGKDTSNEKFCSRRCAVIVTNSTHPRRKKQVVILTICRCGKSCKSAGSTFCSQRCVSDDKIERWLSGDLIATSTSGFVRRWLVETHGEKCSICDWANVHPVTGNIPVEVDHIDRDHLNNRPENLRLLCPNCHSLTPTFRNLNAGRGRIHRRKTS